ncbi:MAG: ribonuclease III family protein, partial [Vicinamibacterales bacterium]
EKTGGRLKQALLADAYEALIAAIYLDGGMAQARAFVAREFAPLLAHVRESGVIGQDHKSALQEYLQSHDRPLPEYRLAGTAGPDHRKRFLVEAVVEGEGVATGSGSSKREAEQEAARLALASLLARADGT